LKERGSEKGEKPTPGTAAKRRSKAAVDLDLTYSSKFVLTPDIGVEEIPMTIRFSEGYGFVLGNLVICVFSARV
jgi:hypothetical protein